MKKIFAIASVLLVVSLLASCTCCTTRYAAFMKKECKTKPVEGCKHHHDYKGEVVTQ